MADLRTDYQDDVLDASKNTARVYDLVDSNGTVVLAGVHLEDKTVYKTKGGDYGAADINEQNGKINELSNDLTELTTAFEKVVHREVTIAGGKIEIQYNDTLPKYIQTYFAYKGYENLCTYIGNVYITNGAIDSDSRCSYFENSSAYSMIPTLVNNKITLPVGTAGVNGNKTIVVEYY